MTVPRENGHTIEGEDKDMKEYEMIIAASLRNAEKKHPGENLLISPLSLMITLAQIRISEDPAYAEEASKLAEVMTAAKETVMADAFALVREGNFRPVFSEEYKERFEKLFGSEVFYTPDPAKTLNTWVREKTHGMITDLFQENEPGTLLTHVNSICFEDLWQEMYREDNISEEEFTNADGSVRNVQMMYSTEYTYMEDEHFRGFARPFKNSGYDFVGIIPKDGHGITADVLKKLDICELYSKREESELAVGIPEFSAEMTEKSDVLLEGICPISTNRGTSVTNTAKVIVDRKGTRAAAAASYRVLGCFLGPDPVALDSPFIYALMHRETGLPLFAGTVNRL